MCKSPPTHYNNQIKMQKTDRQVSIEATLNNLNNSILPTLQQIQEVCSKAKQILSQEPNILELPLPLTVCGNTHGQFYDLLELFKLGGPLPSTRYLFLGNYVNRGLHSIETFVYLLALKVKYPGHIYLLRGNHECKEVCQVYGFFHECQSKYNGQAAWLALSQVFDYLPLAAVVDGKVFCVHGGLSKQITSLDQISKLNRFQQVPHEGPVTDLLWSDPSDTAGWTVSPRGAGYLFGPDVTEKFLHENNLKTLLRSHKLVDSGHELEHNNMTETIFSAPNYCYRCGNKGAFVRLGEGLAKEVVKFDASKDPRATVRVKASS